MCCSIFSVYSAQNLSCNSLAVCGFKFSQRSNKNISCCNSASFLRAFNRCAVSALTHTFINLKFWYKKSPLVRNTGYLRDPAALSGRRTIQRQNKNLCFQPLGCLNFGTAKVRLFSDICKHFAKNLCKNIAFAYFRGVLRSLRTADVTYTTRPPWC